MSVYDDWVAGGSVDYNKKVAEGVPGFQSSNPSITYGSGTGEGTPYWKANMGDHPSGGSGVVTAQPFGSATPDTQGGQNQSLSSQAGTAAQSQKAKLQSLFDNPGSVINSVLRGLGIDPELQGAGQYAQAIRKQSSLLKPAFSLWQGGEDPSKTGVGPEDYIKFAGDFLGTLGGNLGDKSSLIKRALGMEPGQPEMWATMLNSPDLTDDERQSMISALYNINTMGSSNPFTQYQATKLGRMGQNYGEYAASPASGLNPLFMDYIKSHLPEFMK